MTGSNGKGAIDEAIDAVRAAEKVKEAPSDRITDAEMPYWMKVNEGAGRANQLMQQAQGLRAQAAQLEGTAQALMGAFASYAGHLAEIHGIPDDGRINTDGSIVREESPAKN